MNNRLLAEGMLLGMSSFGMVIDKWEDNIMYISVPKDSTDYGPTGEALAGKKLADRIQTKLRDLGEFKHVRQLREDFYVDDFLAINTKTNELCLVLSREIKGVGGGLSYSVHPMKSLGNYKITGELCFAEWKMVLDDFDDGQGNRELPHCSKCSRGVYRHDAGLYCPFCGSLMKNPMRY